MVICAEMKAIQRDLKSNKLSVNEAVDVTQIIGFQVLLDSLHPRTEIDSIKNCSHNLQNYNTGSAVLLKELPNPIRSITLFPLG